jgi:hypothetical protein
MLPKKITNFFVALFTIVRVVTVKQFIFDELQ